MGEGMGGRGWGDVGEGMGDRREVGEDGGRAVGGMGREERGGRGGDGEGGGVMGRAGE